MNISAFLQLAIDANALQFGEFTLKSGRQSPYFFNAGYFNTASSIKLLGEFYADRLVEASIEFDMLFGPAYKGIPLATSLAIAIEQKYQRNVPMAFNRKEAKDHGEGGVIMGASLMGKVFIVDDVITAGTAIRQSIDLIRQAGAQPAGVIVALDRQECGPNGRSAIQEVEEEYSIPVISIASLTNLLNFVGENPEFTSHLKQLTAYRQEYGVE